MTNKMKTKQKKKPEVKLKVPTYSGEKSNPEKSGLKKTKKIQREDLSPYLHHPFGWRWIWMMNW